jgi:hypothetical protein
MPFVKCECGWRGIANQLPSHKKRCVKRLRILKSKDNQKVTQTLDYRIDLLSKFDIDTKELDLVTMPDLKFNDLIFRLETLKNEKLEKEEKLKSEKKLVEQKQKKIQVELDKKEKLEVKRKAKEEADRIEQANRTSETEKNIIKKKEVLENSFIEKRESQSKPKTIEEVINTDIQTIDSLVEKSINELPKKKIDPEQIDKPTKSKKTKKVKSKKVA